MTLNLEQFLFTILPHGEQTVSINYQDSIGEFKTERVIVNKENRDANRSEILEIVRDSCLFAETDSVPEIVRDVVRNATIEV